MLPQDPVMLLSYVNTKLRDVYPSLAALCEEEDVRPEMLRQVLAAIGYEYSEARNQFI